MALALATATHHDVAPQTFEHPSPRPVDLVHLRRFTFGDAALEQEILGLFVEQTPKTIAALRSATTLQDWKMAAHSLKGAARAIGAWRVARMGEQAERMAAEASDPDQRRRLIELVEAAAAEAEAYIRALSR